MSRTRRTITLQGLKASRPVAAQWISSLAGPLLSRRGVVTYSIVAETPARVERRRATRRPVRLQSGKMLDQSERFLTEFVIRNRAETGICLKLARCVVLPRSVLLFDDQQGALLAASIVWQRGNDAGCRISRDRPPFEERLLARLRERYYAVD